MNWDYDKLHQGQLEEVRRWDVHKVLISEATKESDIEQLRRDMDAMSDAFEYWKKYCLYQEALDYASK